MPTQTELKFYEAFGIEPDHHETCLLECKPGATLKDFKQSGCDKKDTCPHNKIEDFYPEITLERLLKMLAARMLVANKDSALNAYVDYLLQNDKELKRFILEILIQETNSSEQFYKQVRKIMGVILENKLERKKNVHNNRF